MVAVLSKPVTSVAAVRDTRAAPNKRARTMRETDSTPAEKKKDEEASSDGREETLLRDTDERSSLNGERSVAYVSR